ncbi:MAG: carboxypeptidase regulatory-like domain-containing protein, partial [Planctomycetes bacterium]|nr:carboxypeptidase regulatory-like domain-containing protein [Planctomycetota bacterium]
VKSIVLDPNNPFVIVLQKSQPITGTVVSKETGLPIANAEIRVLRLSQENATRYAKTPQDDPDEVTDQKGYFSLDQVCLNWKHLVHIAADGYISAYLEDLPVGKHGLHIELGNKQPIKGTIIGDLSQLLKNEAGLAVITAKNDYPEYGLAPISIPVIIQNDRGTFEINDYWGQTVTLRAGDQHMTLKPEEDDLDNITFDLRSTVTREVVLQFDIPDNMPPIQGQVRIDRVTQRDNNRIRSKADWVDITENQISFKSSAPGQFRYRLDFYKELPVGYWFKESDYRDVAIGTEPMVINVPVYPAGGIYGKILRADGTLAKEARASLRVIKWPDNMEISHGDRSSLTNALSNRVNLGTYNAAPLPLGGTYAIMAYEGCTVSMTDPFMLDQTKPMIEADLQLPKGETLTGRVLDPDGKPATRTVRLYISVNHGKASLGRSDMETQPDKNGQFVFENVNPGPGGSCEVLVMGQNGYRPIKQAIKDLSQPVIIRLKKGHRVTGTVIDQDTGWPVPGVEVNASAAENAQGDYASNWEFLKAETKTDAQGKFQFTNMDTCFYRLNTQGANLAFPNRPLVVKGGQKDTVTVSVALPTWSELKPTKPE